MLLVHAHPDDETLSTGGTIARYAALGAQVAVVTCTLGEEGEIVQDDLRGLASDRADQLGGYRVGELTSACAALGVTDHRFLGGLGRWRDSGMVWQRAGRASAVSTVHPRALVAGVFEEQVRSLIDILLELRPQVVVTYAADGGYGHPDHIRAHEITMAATKRVDEVQRVFHTVPSRNAVHAGLRHLAATGGMPFDIAAISDLPTVQDRSITTVINIGEYLPAKISALRAHATQVRVWPNASGVGAYSLIHDPAHPLIDTEHYVLATGDPQGCADDLFGGLVDGFGGQP